MPNKYDAFLADSVGEDQYNGVLQDLPTLDPASLAKAGAVAPDVAAESQKLSASTGLPPDVVQRNMDEVKQRTQLNDYNRFVTENPELLNLARDPNFSQVAHDDTQSIGLLKNIFYKLKDSAASIVGGALVGAESMAKAGQMALGDVVISSDGLKYVPPSEIKNMAPDVIENFLMGWGKQYLNQNSGTTPFATWQDVKDADGVVETAVATGAFGIDQMITSVPYMALSLASLPASALSYSGRLLESRLENRGDSTITPEDLNIAFVGGTVAAALDRYGAEQVLGSIKALGATAVRRIARAAVAEAATEAPQEGIEYLTENLGIKPITLQALGDRMLAGAVGAGIAGGAMRGGIEVTYSGVSYIAKRNADAAQAKAAGEALGELTQAVQDSQLRERSPEQFSRLVDALAPDTELYLDPIDAGEALQQSEADIPPGLTERVADAEAHGVPVRVTAAEYATYLSSDPNLAKRVRFGRPDAMTVEEADAVQKEFDARAEAVLADADHADALKAQAVEIHNNIRDQVVATGRFRADVAGAYATLMENFYVATAARLGITPGEMYQRYPVRITPDSAVTGPESLAQIPPESFRTEQHDGGATIFATDPGTGNEIGKLETVPRGDTEIQIKFADLAPSMRGQGIGQQLIEQAYSVATQQGKKLVSDNVVSAAQLRAYEGLRRKGWTIEYSDPVKVQEILDLAARRPERAAALGVAGDAPVVTRIEPPGSLKQNIALPPWAEEYAALGGVIEPDGTTVVWHATTKDKAAKILQQGVLKRPSDAPDSYGVYFAGGRDAKSVASDYGDGTLIPVRVRVADIKPDDIFPGRRLDFSAATKNGIYRPVAVGEAALKPLGSLQQPMYHGSPHDFTHFSLEHIGTGEGAQAYGHGLYFAEDPRVAKSYMQLDNPNGYLTVQLPNGNKIIGDSISDKGLQAIAALEKGARAAGQFKHNTAYYAKSYSNDPEVLQLINEWKDAKIGYQKHSSLYKVDIPGTAIEKMLDWDKPMSEQPIALANIKKIAALPEFKNGLLGEALQPFELKNTTGQTVQNILSTYFDNDKEKVSGLLNRAGIPGLKYLDAGSRDEGKGTHNVVVWDQNVIDELNKQVEKALYQQGDRGQISFARTDGQMTGLISLFQSADLTTFLHEGGHFYMEVLSDLAAQPDAPPGVREDMEALLKWFNYDGTVEEWRALSLDERRANHEQFARGFENWLMEGKAPSEPLRRMFQRFRAWLINIYKSVAGLNVRLTDEVRGVMSRMVATQEQIQEAEQARDYAPLFDQQAASGLSPEEWATYQESAALATEYAQDQLQAKSLRNLRYLDNARSKELKRLQKENALKRAQVEAEVADEVAREPVRIAETLLKDGVTWTPGPDGNPVEVTLDGPHKLSRAKLEADYGSTADYKAVAAAAGAVDTSRVRAPWQQLPASLLTSGEGLSADEVAELVGMTSGDELVQSLLAMQPREQVISRLTDQRVLERYGELNDPAELQRAVDQAIHNRFRARVVATELAALDASLKQLPGGLPALRRAARHAAEDVVNRTRIRDVRPGQFAAAETRAAKDARAALESGDLKTASIRKRDQMFNGYAAKNAAKMLDRVDTGLDYLRKFNRDSTRKALDPSYRDQIDKMLERFDLRKVSLTQLDKRASLLEWIKEQEADGNEPVIPDYLLDEARRKNYRNMTVQEFTDLVDAVKNIEHLGRLKQRLLTVQKQRRFAEVVADLANSINENAPEGPSKQTLERDLTLWGRVAAVTHEWLTHLRKLSSVARQVDGGKDGGVFWDNFVRPLNAAGDVELTMRRKAAVRLHELTQQVPAFNPSLARQAGQRITGPRKLYIPEIKTSLSTEARLAVALNWGNEGNRQRIMDGNKWTETQAKAVIDTLTKDEMNFVQNVFDFIGEYWPEIAAKEERVTGIRPPRVEATPIITRHGTYPGGYYPIVADSMRSEISAQQNDAELISQALKGAVTRATTRRGHTKARVGGTAPVRLDLGVITQHVSQVIHDLAWHETLIDVGRLLRAPDVSNAIRDHYGAEFTRLMRKTFDDVARGEVVARDAGEKVVNYFRVGSTIAGLGLSVNTALLQLTGFAQSVVRVGYGPMLRGLMEFSARPMESIKRVREASAFMAERSELLNRELGEITNTLDGKPRSLTRFYFMPIQAFQVAVDVPTWLAAYNKAIASPDISHDQAVAMADQAVRDAQSSGATHDLAEVQRGNAYKKLLTNFYSYFSATYQLSAESIQNFKREKSAAAAIKMASDFFMLYAVPTGLGLLIREGLRGDLDDEDELALHFFQELLANILGVFPYIREIAGAIQGYEYRGPAGLSVLAHGTAVVQQVEQGEVDEALLRAMNRFGGVAFHYPSSQVDRTVRGIIAVSEGDAGPQAVLVGPPKKE